MMGYRPPMQMPTQMPAQNRVIKRPISDMEKQFAVEAYKSFRKTMIGPAIFAIALLVINSLVLPSIGAPEGLVIVFQIFAIVFGLAALVMSINLMVVRKKVEGVFREGTAIEVQGPAYKNRTNRNVEAWQVGPISMTSTRGLSQMMVEGAPTSVLFVPKLKAAISINNMGLKQSVRVTAPPNIEMMAVPMSQAPQPMTVQPIASPVSPQYNPYTPQYQQQYPQYNPGMPKK